MPHLAFQYIELPKSDAFCLKLPERGPASPLLRHPSTQRSTAAKPLDQVIFKVISIPFPSLPLPKRRCLLSPLKPHFAPSGGQAERLKRVFACFRVNISLPTRLLKKRKGHITIYLCPPGSWWGGYTDGSWMRVCDCVWPFNHRLSTRKNWAEGHHIDEKESKPSILCLGENL